jgi:hypothetical protein
MPTATQIVLYHDALLNPRVFRFVIRIARLLVSHTSGYFLHPRLTHILAAQVNPLTPELNPTAQRYLTRLFTGILLLEPTFR